MKKFVGLSVVLLLVGCGMSEGDKQQLASSTCNMISNAAGDDSTARLKELNSAREQLGEALYTGSDDDIRDSVKFGICQDLVLNDPAYGSLVTQNREMVAAEKKRIDGVAAVTCSVMGETRNMDSAVRIKEMNAARVDIGEDPFLDGDAAIKEAFKYGLCESLVKNESTYSTMLAEMKKIESEALAAKRQLERERRAEERRAREVKEQERIQRISGPLKEWRSAIVARIRTESDPIKDVTFDVQYSDMFPLEVEYVCSGFDYLDTTFIVTFVNELGTLTARNSSGSSCNRTTTTSFDISDSDKKNLYTVIGDQEKGSLLSSVESIDVEIIDTSPGMAKYRVRGATQRAIYKYVDPENFHKELSGSDLRLNPIKLRIYPRALSL